MNASSELICIAFFIGGAFICIGNGQVALMGLGVMIVGGLLRIAFAIEHNQLDELQRRIDALNEQI